MISITPLMFPQELNLALHFSGMELLGFPTDINFSPRIFSLKNPCKGFFFFFFFFPLEEVYRFLL